jgi:hypothetical protein
MALGQRRPLPVFLHCWRWQVTREASLSRRRMGREAAVGMKSPARPGGSAARRERGMGEWLASTGVCCLNMTGACMA